MSSSMPPSEPSAAAHNSDLASSQPEIAEVFLDQSPVQSWQGAPTGEMPQSGYPSTPSPSQLHVPQGGIGAPSSPYLPQGYSGMASQPYYAGQPMPAQPWMGYQAPWPDGAGGGVTLPPPTTKAASVATLAQPLPMWSMLVGGLAVTLMLVGLEIMGRDWADGALHVGIAAGALAMLVVLATGVRSAAGMAAKTNERRRAQYIGAVMITAIFLALSGAGIGLQTPIHRLQANVLAGNQRWQEAINELQLAGEVPPTSEALAQIYDAWGEHLSATQHYQAASDKLFFALDTFSGATHGVKRAQADIITTFIAWGNHDSQQHSYQDATRQFDFVLNQSYCASDCQSRVNALDATAYYNLAEADLSAQKYTDAISAFSVIASRFATSPEAQKIHGDYASALYQAGQQDIATASTCAAAIPLYQQLTKEFADTPPAKLAATALAAPQGVKGQFSSGPPANTLGIVSLLKNARIDLKTQDFVGTPTLVSAVLIKSDGSFAFAPVAQGVYSLAWQTIDKNGNITSFSFYYTNGTGDPYYTAAVGPLCPFDFGTISDPVYLPQTGNVVIRQESAVVALFAKQHALITLIGVASPRNRRFITDLFLQ